MTAHRRGGGQLPPASGRAITGWTTGLLLAGVLPQYLVASLVVEMRNDFSMSDAQLGLAIGVSFAISAVISPLAGRALGRIGIRRGVLVSAVMITISSAALATAIGSAAGVIAAMALGGLGGGIGSPSYSALLAARVGTHRHGLAFGMLTSAPQMAAFAAGLALPLIAQPLNWRAAFAIAAALALVCLIVLLRAGMPRSVPRSESVDEVPSRPHGSVWTMAGATVLASAAGIGMRSFLVVFAVSVGFSDANAGLLLAASGLLAMVSRVGFGLLGDRRPGDSLRQVAWLMLLCACGFALMALGGTAAIVAGALIAGGLGWGWQSPMSLAVVTQNRHATGAAIGIQMSGFFAGATVGPLMVGVLAEQSSYSVAWLACALLAVVGAAVAMLARHQAPRFEPGIPST